MLKWMALVQAANSKQPSQTHTPALNEEGKKIGPRWAPIDVPEDVLAKCGRVVVAHPSNDARGHTGYLTFAWKGLWQMQADTVHPIQV